MDEVSGAISGIVSKVFLDTIIIRIIQPPATRPDLHPETATQPAEHRAPLEAHPRQVPPEAHQDRAPHPFLLMAASVFCWLQESVWE